MIRHTRALVALVVLVGAFASPLAAQAHGGDISDEETGTHCPNDRWELLALDLVDDSVKEKALKRDTKGNNDGLVCQRAKQHRELDSEFDIKYSVKDNNKPAPDIDDADSDDSDEIEVDNDGFAV